MGAAEPFNNMPDQHNGGSVFLATAGLSAATTGLDSSRVNFKHKLN